MKKVKISLDDAETRAIYESALQAKREVESWPAWKRGEPVWEREPVKEEPMPKPVKKSKSKKSRSTMADVKRAKAAFDEQRDRRHAVGMEVCMVVVGYVSGKDPFRLLGRVSADTGFDVMPDPPLTDTEMQPVAFAAKMAFAKALVARKRKR